MEGKQRRSARQLENGDKVEVVVVALAIVVAMVAIDVRSGC